MSDVRILKDVDMYKLVYICAGVLISLWTDQEGNKLMFVSQ